MKLANRTIWLAVLVVLSWPTSYNAVAEDIFDPGPAPPPTPPAATPAASTVSKPVAAAPTPAAPQTPAAPTASAPSTPATAKPAETYKQPAVVIHLLSGEHLSGALAQAADLPMRSSFGEIRIPYSEVAGVRLAREGSLSSTVVLHNGDSVTGAVTLDTVTIETDWGKAEVNGSAISSLVFTPGTKWVSENTLSGTRWKLVAEEPAKNATAQGGAANQNRAMNYQQFYRGR